MRLSVIIVNYNVTQLLRKCILSIGKFVQNVDYEIIVIDNASPDSSWKSLIAEFPDVHFVASEENGGFAVANNLGVERAKGKYVLLLNPDTELEGDYMKEVLDFAEAQEDFGCLGLRLHDAHGNFLPESKRSVPDMFNSFEKLFTGRRSSNAKSYYRNDIAENEIAEVEVITGAFLLAKKETYRKIGGLDEAYFMYGEDIDLCYTFLQNGFKNWYYGKYSVLHHKGESTVKDEKYLARFYGAMQIFVNKYYGSKPLQKLIVSAGLKVRHRLEKAALK